MTITATAITSLSSPINSTNGTEAARFYAALGAPSAQQLADQFCLLTQHPLKKPDLPVGGDQVRMQVAVLGRHTPMIRGAPDSPQTPVCTTYAPFLPSNKELCRSKDTFGQ